MPGLTEAAATRNIRRGVAARMGEKGTNRRMADSGKTAEANAGVPFMGARFPAGEMLSVSGGLHPSP